MGDKGLRDHITRTYFSLRMAMIAIGTALPVALVLGGRLLDRTAPVRDSMSDYYNSPVMRDVFVGSLITVGVLLVLYRGFSRAEDRAFDFAGVFAIGTALFPVQTAVHGPFAVAFFVCVGYVCLFRAEDTLHLIKSEVRDRWKRLYQSLGLAMILLPVTAAVLAMLLFQSRLILAVEWAAVWVFGAYWIAKSLEFRRTHAEELAAAGRLTTVREAPVRAPELAVSEGRLRQAFSNVFGDQAVLEADETIP